MIQMTYLTETGQERSVCCCRTADLVRCYDLFYQNCPVNPLSRSSVELTTGHYNII